MKNEIATGFNAAIAMVKDALLEDGRIDLVETAFLLRLVKPAALRGVPEAVALEAQLKRIRDAGAITPEESARIIVALGAAAGLDPR